MVLNCMIHHQGLWITDRKHAIFHDRCHTATTINKWTTVMVTGGYNGVYLNSAELYNLSSDLWITDGSMNNAREYHTATTINKWKDVSYWWMDIDAYLNSAEFYDSSLGIWTTTTSMNDRRAESHSNTINKWKCVSNADGYDDGTII